MPSTSLGRGGGTRVCTGAVKFNFLPFHFIPLSRSISYVFIILFYPGTEIWSILYIIFRCLCTEFLFSLFISSLPSVISSRDWLDFALFCLVSFFLFHFLPPSLFATLPNRAKWMGQRVFGGNGCRLGDFFSSKVSFYPILLYSTILFTLTLALNLRSFYDYLLVLPSRHFACTVVLFPWQRWWILLAPFLIFSCVRILLAGNDRAVQGRIRSLLSGCGDVGRWCMKGANEGSWMDGWISSFLPSPFRYRVVRVNVWDYPECLSRLGEYIRVEVLKKKIYIYI